MWDSSADMVASREPLQQRRSLERIFLGFAHSFMNQRQTPLSQAASAATVGLWVAVPATKNWAVYS